MSDLERITSTGSLPRRPRRAHKGTFGRVLVVGGSRGMVGAPALTALAALRGGAGLVTLAAPETVQLAVATLCPCATSVPLACDEAGHVAPAALRTLREAIETADVLAVGPGLAVGAAQQDVIRLVLASGKPIVLDADGLNNLARLEDWPALRRGPFVLTPHPGEFSRLTGRPIAEIESDREQAAAAAVREWTDRYTEQCPPLVCLLKGADTVVTDGRGLYVNDTGNPGMATGGSGDVLTGLLAALMAQGLSALSAACLSARVHGRAGDLAAEVLGEVSVIATDLIDHLPQALRESGKSPDTA